MKVFILSESPADEAAIRILIDCVLGRQTEFVDSPLRPRGWPSVLHALPKVINHLYYQTDAEAFVMVVDSDNTPAHQQAHDQPDGANEKCRLCQLRKAAAQIRQQIRDVPGRATIKTAFGLAVPAIEAWFRCGVDPQINEAGLIQKLGAPIREIKNRLKMVTAQSAFDGLSGYMLVIALQ